MGTLPKYLFAFVLLAGGASAWQVTAGAKPAPTIRSITSSASGNNVEVEISTSAPVSPHAQVLTGPDRLIIDFPNSVPAVGLRNVPINRGQVKGVRVGLFASNVTRVVVDLKTAQPYQLVSSGNTVIVKLNGVNLNGAPAAAVSNTPPPPLAKPAPRVEVSFQNGELRLWANGATLAQVLFEVQRRTGADIPIPAGADQDQVFANYGPAPAREVMASLLNGSRYNFIMVASDRDPAQLRSLLLTPRGAAISQPANYAAPATLARVTPQPEPNVDVEPVQDPPTADDPPPQPSPQR